MQYVKTFAAVCLLLSISSLAPAQTVIYQHDFNGTADKPLYGLSPDVDNSGLGTIWVTRTDTGLPGGVGREWYADGHIDTTLDPNRNGSASLAFSPVAGKVYTLTASITSVFTTGVGDSFAWIGMGFSAGEATGDGGGAEFFGNNLPDQITGQPWMMHRADTSVHNNITALGPSVDGIAGWPVQFVPGGSPIDMQIVLDTTTPLWTVEWLAKAPADSAFMGIRTAAYATNPTIRAIALASNFNIGGTVDRISLTVVPEPGSLLLGGLAMAALLPLSVRRR